MRIVYIHSANPQEAYRVHLRCINQARAINRLPLHHADLVSFDDFLSGAPQAEKACQSAEILVLHRHLTPPVVQALYHWKARDKKIIVDMDLSLDALEAEPEDGARPLTLVSPEQYRLSLRLADLITVPTACLAHEYQPFAQTCLIPDALNTDEYLTPRKEQLNGQIWLGMGGDETNVDSLKKCGLLTALERVCSLRPQVGVALTGVNSPPPDFLAAIPKDRKKIIPAVSFEEWIKLLSGLDIGLAPIFSLQETCWSSIRVLEYMALKIPWVASDHAPYQAVKRYGWITGNTAEAWEYILLELIDHLLVYRAEASGESFIVALGQDVNENIVTTINAYQSVIA